VDTPRLQENFISYREVIKWAMARTEWSAATSGEDLAGRMLSEQGFRMERYELVENPCYYGWFLVRRDG